MPASVGSVGPARPAYPRPTATEPITARVLAVRRVRPSTVRITLGLADDRAATTALTRGTPGRYCTLLLPRGGGADPVARHFTVRDARPEYHEIDLDVVRHDTPGPDGVSVAMRWLAGVRAGQQLSVAPAGPGWRPRADRDRLLYVADATALPAVCAQLEGLPSLFRASVVGEVSDPCDEPDVVTCAPLDSTWTYLGPRASGDPFALLDAVDRALRGWSTAVRERTSAWVAGEAATVAVLQRYLVRRHGLRPGDVTARAYWRREPALLG